MGIPPPKKKLVNSYKAGYHIEWVFTAWGGCACSDLTANSVIIANQRREQHGFPRSLGDHPPHAPLTPTRFKLKHGIQK